MVDPFVLGSVVGLVLLAAFVGGPLLIWFTQTTNAQRDTRLIEPEAVPADTYEFFKETAPGLTECGFSIASYLRLDDLSVAAHATGYVALWVNRPAGQAAAVTSLHCHPKNGPAKIQHWSEFVTHVVNGLHITTANSDELSVAKAVSGKNVLMASAVKDVVELYRLHLSRELQLVMPAATRYLPPAGHEADWFVEDCQVSLLEQEESGYWYYAGSRKDVYRPTLVGAFIMVWRILPPIKQIRAARMRRRVRQAIEQAEGLHLSAPKAVPITHQSPYAHKLDRLRGDWLVPNRADSPREEIAGGEQATAATVQLTGTVGQTGCPFCAAPLPADTTLCGSCGRDTKTGRTVKEGQTQPGGITATAKRTGAFAIGVVLSGIAVLIGAAVWSIVAISTGYELGLIAWGLGGVAGYGMFLGYRRQSTMAGLAAAGTAVVGILAAKVTIFVFVIYAVATGNTDNIDLQRGFVARQIMEEILHERQAWFGPEREAESEAAAKEAQQQVEAMSDEVVRTKAEEYRLVNEEPRDLNLSVIKGQWERMRVAAHFASRRADEEGIPYDDSRREELYEQELTKCEKMSDEEVASEIAKLVAHEEGELKCARLAGYFAKRHTAAEGIPYNDSRREELLEQQLAKCEKMSDEEIDAEIAKLVVHEEGELKRARLARHFATRRADTEGMPYDDSRREELYEQELATCEKMSDEDVDLRTATLDAWEEGQKWSDPAYVRDYLIYAAIDRALEGEDGGVVAPANWQRLYESASADVAAIPTGERKLRARQVQAAQERQFEEAMQEFAGLYETEYPELEVEAAREAAAMFFSTMFSGFDILCILFAGATAYKIGSGRMKTG